MALKASELSTGQTFTAVVVEDLKRTQIVQYAGASGDYNPLHTDEVFATQAAGYPSVFAHGMLTAGLTSKCVTDYVGRPSLRVFKVSFRSQVWPGDTITVGGKVTRKFEDKGEKRVEGEILATNQKGEPVIQGGFVAALPSR